MKLNTRFSKDRLDLYSLNPSTNELLRVIGLPINASPSLYFGDFDGMSLPRLRDWPWLKLAPPMEYGDYIVLGEGGGNDNRPICLRENDEQIFILDQDKSFDCTFMNSSVMQLLGSLNSHQEMIQLAILDFDDEVYLERRIPEALINAFEADLHELDSAALDQGAFWTQEILLLRRGLAQFTNLKKYQFKLYGQMMEYGPLLSLESVTIAADVDVVRALADFFSLCANDMEKYGPDWDHEHFRGRWSDWYSKYPDIVVHRARDLD